LSEGVEGQSRAPYSPRVGGHSTFENRWPRNSYRQVGYVYAARAASTCHWSWTAVSDDRRPTKGDGRRRGTQEQHQPQTDVRARQYEHHSLMLLMLRQPVQLP